MASKYEAQHRHLRENYVKFGMNLKPEFLQAFKDACAKNGTTPTTELKKFMSSYIIMYGDGEIK